jgi:cyclase
MLKKRIVATLIVKDYIVVQSIGFNRYLPIGRPEIAVEYLNQWGIDEIIYLDISARANKTGPNFEIVKKVAKKCFVPLTIGGGINNIKQIKELIKTGADKVCFNNILFSNPKIISETASLFGNQCVVVSVDVVRKDGKYYVYDYLLKKSSQYELLDYLFLLKNFEIGEVFLNSVDRDGSYLGYDTDLINLVCNNVRLPVICSGGAKNASDISKVLLETNVSGASASNFFHFTEHSVNITKKYISEYNLIRVDNLINYYDSELDENIRLLKKDDLILEKMLFEKIIPEKI